MSEKEKKINVSDEELQILHDLKKSIDEINDNAILIKGKAKTKGDE